MLLSVVLTVGLIVLSTMWAAKHFGLALDFKKLLSADRPARTMPVAGPEIPPAPDPRTVFREPVETVTVEEMVELRRLLEEGQYDQLEALLQWCQNRRTISTVPWRSTTT